MRLEHFFTPYTKINSKWIKDLTVRTETIKLLEENIGSKLSEIGLSNNIFADWSPQLRETRLKNKQMGPNQTQKLFHSEGNRQQNKRATYQMGEDICK